MGLSARRARSASGREPAAPTNTARASRTRGRSAHGIGRRAPSAQQLTSDDPLYTDALPRGRARQARPHAQGNPGDHATAPPYAPQYTPKDRQGLLPGVDELFPRPELEPRMKKYLVRLANETSNALIRDTLSPEEAAAAASTGRRHSVLWRPSGHSAGQGVQILRGAARERHEAQEAACARAVSEEVHASIEEFALLFKLDSSREAADHALLFNADLRQQATLYALVAPSGAQPRRYVGVKWALVASPSRFFRDRDFCYLECQKEFRDAHGRRGWVRALHSLKLPCCPPLEREHGVVRASIYRSGLTAVETDEPGVLRVTYTVELDLKGHMALELLQPGFLAQRVAALASVDKLLQQQRLSSSPLLGDLDLPARKRVRGACHLCFREFAAANGGLRSALASLTRHAAGGAKRFVCRKCGEGVCRRCSDDWWLDVPVVGRTKVRICTVCSAEAKHSHISAQTARAARPVTRQPTVTTQTDEVEGVTHPGLLRLPGQRRRSLSMTDNDGNAQAFFATQAEIKRDLELRATELSARVQLWDEMQVYNREYSFSAAPEHQLPQQQQRSSQWGSVPAEPAEQHRPNDWGATTANASAQHPSLWGAATSDVPVQQHDRQWGAAMDAPGKRRESSVELGGGSDGPDDEPEVEVEPQQQPRRQPQRQSSVDERPSFLSSEMSSQGPSDSEPEDVTAGRISAAAAARLSAEFRDSDLTDYEEHTIDDMGAIRTTTDLTRWWQDQLNEGEEGETESSHKMKPSLSPVASPTAKSVATEKSRTRGWESHGTAPRSLQHPDSPTQQQRPSAAPSHGRNSRQEMADLFHHWKQESSNELEHLEQQKKQAQQNRLAFEEQYRYQQQQQLLLRQQQHLQAKSSHGSSALHNNSVLQQIQQRQKELQQLQRQHQLPRDEEPPVEQVRPHRAQRKDKPVDERQQSMEEIKEQHLQKQRAQQMQPSGRRGSHARLQATRVLDQTAGEDVELMETSKGEWVPSHTPRDAPIDAAARLEESSLSPSFCTHCGSPEYLSDAGVVKRSCLCGSSEQQVSSFAEKPTGAVLFDGKWISSGQDERTSVVPA